MPSAEPAVSLTAKVPEVSLEGAYECELSRGIKLIVCPGKEISWDDFQRLSPNYSIAIDGLVRGAPRFDIASKRGNFNHHQDVDRLATRSTSGQIFVALKQGLMDSFRDGGSPRLNIFANDPDQDSCLAIWQLVNHERFLGQRSEPLLNKLIFAEDLLDTTAGAYPFEPNSELMRELAWIFDPYVEARMAGRIRSMQGAEMANLIDAVCSRISKYSLGQGQRKELDTRFEEIGGADSWRMIKETGFYARTGLFARGVRAFISYLGGENEAHHYSIGKMSPYVQFPILDLYGFYNHLEGLDVSSAAYWSGGDITGGSPRRVGSRLAPKALEAATNDYLRRSNSIPQS